MSSQDAPIDPVPSEVAEFIDFFRESLADLKFPDVDLSTLDELTETVRQRARELGQLNEQVRIAREALEQARSELDGHARRGLAYLTVYAEGDAKLSEAVAALELGQASTLEKPAAKGKGKGRKIKADKKPGNAGKPTGELPFTAKSEPAPAAKSDAA